MIITRPIIYGLFVAVLLKIITFLEKIIIYKNFHRYNFEI